MELGYYKAFMPVYIEKSGDLVRCHHSGTDNRTRKDRADSANGPRTAEMSKMKFYEALFLPLLFHTLFPSMLDVSINIFLCNG